MKKLFIIPIFVGLTILSNSCKTKAVVTRETTQVKQTNKVSLSPAHWDAGEFEKYIEMDNRAFPANPVAIGQQGAVTTTFHSAASRAGLEALK